MNQFTDEFRNEVLEEAARLADDHPGVAEAIRDSKKNTGTVIPLGDFQIRPNLPSTSNPTYFTADPEYNLVEKLPVAKKGTQCGECGMKFDYGQAYGYHCGNSRCPVGFGSNATVYG